MKKTANILMVSIAIVGIVILIFDLRETFILLIMFQFSKYAISTVLLPNTPWFILWIVTIFAGFIRWKWPLLLIAFVSPIIIKYAAEGLYTLFEPNPFALSFFDIYLYLLSFFEIVLVVLTWITIISWYKESRDKKQLDKA